MMVTEKMHEAVFKIENDLIVYQFTTFASSLKSNRITDNDFAELRGQTGRKRKIIELTLVMMRERKDVGCAFVMNDFLIIVTHFSGTNDRNFNFSMIKALFLEKFSRGLAEFLAIDWIS